MDWRTVTLLRSSSFTDETHSRHSLGELLAIECSSPTFLLPLAAATALLCALLLTVVGGVAVGIVCFLADVALRQRRMAIMLARKLGDTPERVETSSLLNRLTAAEAEWLQSSTGQQLGQIRVNPALMSVKILRERICRSCELIALPHATPDRYELFIKTPSGNVRMAPEHAIGVYAEPNSDIVVELCLRVALLDEPQYQPTGIDPLSQPRVQKCREPSATAKPSVTAVDKLSELGVVDGHHVAAVEQPSTPAHVPVTAAATLPPADPCTLRPRATERKQDYMRSPDGSTPAPEIQTVDSPSPMSPKTAAGDAMLTPNVHAMDAAGVAKLRSMLAAAASPSPSGRKAGTGALPGTVTDHATSPTRSPGPRSGGLSAAEIQKMRGMLQQALVSPTRT